MSSSRSKGHWEFQWSADVQTFWDQHRRVPDRGLAKNYHEERFCLGLYLFALATHELLTYPLSVDQFEEHESPDFMMRWPSGETTGLEVTRATEEGLQKNKSAAHKEYRQRKVDAERSETEPEPVSIPLPTAGWTDGERERGWSLMFRNAVEKKLVKLRGEPPEFRSKFKPAARHDLLVYDDTPFIGVDRTRVIATMQNCIRDLSGQQQAFGKISFISSLDLIFDLGGSAECCLTSNGRRLCPRIAIVS